MAAPGVRRLGAGDQDALRRHFARKETRLRQQLAAAEATLRERPDDRGAAANRDHLRGELRLLASQHERFVAATKGGR